MYDSRNIIINLHEDIYSSNLFLWCSVSNISAAWNVRSMKNNSLYGRFPSICLFTALVRKSISMSENCGAIQSIQI